jgi:hypothetical protein
MVIPRVLILVADRLEGADDVYPEREVGKESLYIWLGWGDNDHKTINILSVHKLSATVLVFPVALLWLDIATSGLCEEDMIR